MTETLSDSLPGDVEALVEGVLTRACSRELTLATAESCTGGLLASVLTDVEGRSHAFECGFATYTDAAKHSMLGVPKADLESHGAVSEVVARAMAEGALKASQADIAVSVTDFAGKAGPDDEEGLVHFALARADRPTWHEVRHFGPAGRGGVRIECLRTALSMFQTALD